MDFTLNGRRLTLTADQVVERVRVAPEPILQHGVRLHGEVYPVKQAFALATGVPRAEFTSQTARRHLAALGLEVVSGSTTREPASANVQRPSAAHGETAAVGPAGEWHTEDRIQGCVVRFLVEQGWEIVKVADTASREHGVDVLARRGDEKVAIEVKGFPSRNYADPARAGETKRTQPSTQAKHWFAQAVLTSMLTRSRRPTELSVIALPDFARYRDLYNEVADSLTAIGVQVWWVGEEGRVDVDSV